MRVFRGMLCIVGLFIASLLPARACGVERWDAKALADDRGLFANVANVDVKYLRSLRRPFGVDRFHARRVSAERHVYRVRGELLGFKIEDDGDIHAVIAQDYDRSSTIIAEIPDPRCMRGAPASYVDSVARTRLAFVRRFGVPPYRSMRLAYEPITLSGPVFFDNDHAQDGAAPNNAEIHPVLTLDSATPLSPPARVTRTTSNVSSAVRPSCPGDQTVWVDLRSGVFHRVRSRWFGRTKRGEYMCQRNAGARGYRAAHHEPSD